MPEGVVGHCMLVGGADGGWTKAAAIKSTLFCIWNCFHRMPHAQSILFLACAN